MMTCVVFYYSIDDDPTLYRGKYNSPLTFEEPLEIHIQGRVLIGLNNSMLQWELPMIQSVHVGPLLHVIHDPAKGLQERVWYDFYGIEDEQQAIAYVQRNSSKL
jgi:hypothetical protein